MASWMIHLRVADLLMDRIPGLDETAFVMGNIAPDSGVPNADWTAYFPPKAVSHYKTRREDETFFDIGRFLEEHFTAEQIRAFSRHEFSFFLGYYVHLLTDVGWTLDIYRPMIAEYVEKRGEDKNTFIWKMKRDWYDLDFRYLEEHPGFRAFNIYEQASGFTNDFMDIFSKDAFDNRREYICGFYRGRHGELYRDYPFLDPARADAFVEKTAESVFDKLKESLAAWNEENTLSLKDLQPSQFYISEKKLQDVQEWFHPSDLANFEAIPVKMLDGVPVMTDGHTRATAAVLAGLESVPLAWDRDDLSWEMYRRCVEECRKRRILSPRDLVHCIVPETDYLEKWDRWCDRMQAEVNGQVQETAALPGNALDHAIKRMTDRIAGIMNNNVHSIWLYGSIVLDDFQPGWSDIDILVLSNAQITEQQAEQLAGLRQAMTEAEPDHPYYRSFEGIIADRNEYLKGSFSRLVYWGTSGQRITDRYQQGAFSSYELAKYGRSVYGENDRGIFTEPSAAELRSAVRQHYESIRRYAVQTDEKLYSCGWLLDIARCIYTLRHNDIIAKTRAGLWALEKHIFADEEPLKKALEIRRDPAAYRDKEDVKQWLKGLGPVVQQYADVLERELRMANKDIIIKKMETDDEIRGKAYVHWRAWHEAYPGMVSQDYLDRFTLEKAEKMAFSWTDGLIVAKDGNRVIGFAGYGDRGKEAPETGEIFCMYILSEYYGTGVGKQLMDAGLEQLKGYPQVCLWVLKENKRAIRFYEKCGFRADGQEMFSKNVEAAEIRMVFQPQDARKIVP